MRQHAFRRRWSRRRNGGRALGAVVVAACAVLLASPVVARLMAGSEAEAAAPRVRETQFAPRDIRIIDGDTLEVLTGGERIRLLNIDAAELGDGARCGAEARHAQAAKAELRLMVRRAEQVTIARTGADAYGRTLAVVRVDGSDAGAALIVAGLARPWEGRRRDWCGAGGQLLR
jgi:endonuclease YncB( thermonuclease family)